MKKQTIALACILKNEIKNLPRMLESVRGCFDEIHLTDTGSTDGSIEWIQEFQKSNPNVFLHHFKWVDDFAAARNASFAPVKTDFIMWMDLDDVLSDREKFIEWRENAMYIADFWLATYQYSLAADGRSLCSFCRERVVRNGKNIKWNYFIHEGLMPDNKIPVGAAYVQTWSIQHLRDAADLAADKSRNLKIFEHHANRDARMVYYYGKELFEAGKPLEAFENLVKAIADPDLQGHDRIMGVQYAAMAAIQLKQYDRAINLCHQGLQLEPNRAELHCLIADSYLGLGKIIEAIPNFVAASHCVFKGHDAQQGPTFAQEDLYKHHPLNQLARIYANMGDLDKAELMVNRALELGPHPESVGILKEIQTVREKCTPKPREQRKMTSEFVITCPPAGLYEWDWKTYQEKGIGGSETAACEMARWIHQLTGRKVIIFNQRKEETSYFDGGVEFRPAAGAPEYFRDTIPAAHVAWRHCTQFADVPTYVWCHDLQTLGMEQQKFHKIFALSPFHRGFLQAMFGIRPEKIELTANGIDPTRFGVPRGTKNPKKVVFSSSPDRGLEAAIAVMDEVVKTHPDVELHVFYGMDNMRKMGMTAQADHLEGLMRFRPYVKFHGNVPQAKLTEELRDAAIWLYPTNFLETYCITALEVICSGVFPVVREWGALRDTLADAKAAGMADVISADPGTTEGIAAFADAVKRALTTKAWERVAVDPQRHSWENVAKQWIEIFELDEGKCQQRSNSMSR